MISENIKDMSNSEYLLTIFTAQVEALTSSLWVTSQALYPYRMQMLCSRQWPRHHTSLINHQSRPHYLTNTEPWWAVPLLTSIDSFAAELLSVRTAMTPSSPFPDQSAASTERTTNKNCLMNMQHIGKIVTYSMGLIHLHPQTLLLGNPDQDLNYQLLCASDSEFRTLKA